MSVDTDAAPRDVEAPAPHGARPWTPEAAMEPLPPLAPPPREPRARVTIVDDRQRTAVRSLVLRAAVAAMVLAALVVALLLTGH